MGFVHDFRRITTREYLVDALGINPIIFQHVLDFDPPPPRDRTAKVAVSAVLDIPAFLRHDIPKKNASRGHRTVWEPLLTKSVYKALARRLDNFFRHALTGYPHESAFGYRPGKNIRENAGAHNRNKFLLAVDVHNFFPSISKNAISQLLQSLEIQDDVSDLLASFVTIGGALPLGLPTSPTISNAIALPVDAALSRLAKECGATYTRYSDDITFSSNGILPELSDITEILAGYRFDIAEAKTRRSTRGQGHYVTGLSISDPLQPHVPKQKKRKLRQELYYANKFGLDDHFRHRGINDSAVVQQEVNRIDGLIKFVAHHEPSMSSGIKTSWRAILNANDMKPSFSPRGQHRAPFVMIVDEAEYARGGTKILALCIVVTQHLERVMDSTRLVLDRTLNDLWADGNVGTLRNRGIHFTDATKDVRLAYVKELAKMPLEGYVAFCACGSTEEYETTYLQLLAAMISRRLMAAESQSAHLLFEQNSKVSTEKIRACVQRAMAELKVSNNRRPVIAHVDFLTKPNPALSAPDFLLGVLGQFLASQPPAAGKPESRERLMFERLRDKYRLILELPTRAEYSRRRPISSWEELAAR